MSEGEQGKGTKKVVLILGGLILVAVVAMFALRSGGGPAGELAGTYIAEAQEGLTLELKTDGTFTSEIKGQGISMKIEGTYSIQGDYVYFFVEGESSGRAEIQDGKLINRGEGITWIKEGWTTPTIKVPEVKTPSLPTQELSPSETVEEFWTAIQKVDIEKTKYYIHALSDPEFKAGYTNSEVLEWFKENVKEIKTLKEKTYTENGRLIAEVNFKVTYKDGQEEQWIAFLAKEDNVWKIEGWE